MDIRSLLTHWGFKVDHNPLNKVEHQLEGIKERLEFLGAIEVVKGLVEVTEKFAKFGQELNVAATNAGITVEQFQRLSFAASKSGVSSDEMSGAMAKLSRNLYEAKTGSKEAQAHFLRAGFTQDQVMGIHNGADAMAILSDKIKNIKEPMARNAILMELMGRGSYHMTAFMAKGSDSMKHFGSEADRLGIVLSHDQVESLEKVEHAFSEFEAVVKAVGATIASWLAPSIETAIHEFTDFYAANKKVIELNLRKWVYDITYAMGFLWGIVKFLIKSFLDFAGAHQLLSRRIGEVLIAFGLLAGAILVVQRFVSLLKGAFGLLGVPLQIIKTLAMGTFGVLKFVVGLALQAVGQLALRIGLLVAETFPALGEAIFAFGEVLLATPVGWFIAGMAALIVILHDAWKLLNGGSFKDTWVGQAFEWAKSGIGKIADFFGLGSGGEEAAGGEPKSGFAAGQAQSGGFISNAMKNITSVGEKASDLTNGVTNFITGGDQSKEQNSSNYEVNAPITMNFQAGPEHKDIAEKVKSGVKEHLDRVRRETSRSVKSAVAY